MEREESKKLRLLTPGEYSADYKGREASRLASLKFFHHGMKAFNAVWRLALRRPGHTWPSPSRSYGTLR